MSAQTVDPQVEDGEVVDAATVDHGPTVAALAVREPLSALLEPAADRETTIAAFGRYQELVRDLLKPADYQGIGADRFVKRSGWRKLATAFGVTLEFRHKEVTFEDPVKGRGVLRAEFVFRATAPNDRYADGWGACSAFERCCSQSCTRKHDHCTKECNGYRHFSKPDHDIPATAETRAKNRACSDLFGMGQVSAEEVFGTAGDQGGKPTAGSAGDAWQDATPAPRRRKAAEATGTKRPAEPVPASGSAGAVVADRREVQNPGEGGTVTQPQLKKMAVLAGKFGWSDDERHRQAGIDTWKNLSKAEASYLIDKWESHEPVEGDTERAAAGGQDPGGDPPTSGGSADLRKQAKALYHGRLLAAARLFDESIRSERDIPDAILTNLIENNL